MCRSFFGRWITIFGVVVNVIGVIGSASPVMPASYFLGICLFLAPRLIAFWSMALGVQMIRYGRRIPAKGNNTAVVDAIPA
jgi:hypothetical protein